MRREDGGVEQLGDRPYLEGTTENRIGKMPTRGAGLEINAMLHMIGDLPVDGENGLSDVLQRAAAKARQEKRAA